METVPKIDRIRNSSQIIEWKGVETNLQERILINIIEFLLILVSWLFIIGRKVKKTDGVYLTLLIIFTIITGLRKINDMVLLYTFRAVIKFMKVTDNKHLLDSLLAVYNKPKQLRDTRCPWYLRAFLKPGVSKAGWLKRFRRLIHRL